MYVCPNCEAKYEDKVAFCAACGTKLVTEEEPKQIAEPAKKEPLAPSLLVFLSNIIHILTGMCITLAVALIDFYIGKYSIYIYPEESCSILAMVLSSVGMGLSIVAMIISLAKGKTAKAKFAGISTLVLASALFVVSIVLASNV